MSFPLCIYILHFYPSIPLCACMTDLRKGSSRMVPLEQTQISMIVYRQVSCPCHCHCPCHVALLLSISQGTCGVFKPFSGQIQCIWKATSLRVNVPITAVCNFRSVMVSDSIQLVLMWYSCHVAYLAVFRENPEIFSFHTQQSAVVNVDGCFWLQNLPCRFSSYPELKI